MVALNRPGRFRAQPTSALVEENKSGLLSVVIAFQATEEWNGSAWTDISAEQQEIVAWQYLSKKDGTLNVEAIGRLREAFPTWDGTDLNFWGGNLNPVQIVCENNEWNGVVKVKVNWINSYNSEGAFKPKFDPATTNSLAAKYGAKLRAISTGAPVTPKAAQPQGPPAQAAAPASISPAVGAGMDKNQAWNEFSHARSGFTPEGIAAAWKAALDLMGKHESLFTPQDWAKVATPPKDSDALPFP